MWDTIHKKRTRRGFQNQSGGVTGVIPAFQLDSKKNRPGIRKVNTLAPFTGMWGSYNLPFRLSGQDTLGTCSGSFCSSLRELILTREPSPSSSLSS